MSKIPIVRTKLITEYDIELSNNKVFGIEGSEDIFYHLIGGSTLEKVAMICLDANNNVINAAITNIGNYNKVDMVPSELFRIAILSNAKYIIVCHNHPSGELKPSLYDIEMTKRIGYLGSLLDIKLIDSLIIGNDKNCYSIRKEINKMEDENELQ